MTRTHDRGRMAGTMRGKCDVGFVAPLFLAVLSLGCGYHGPAAPTPIEPPARTPSIIRLTATAGIGSSAGRIELVARVSDASGGLSAPVHFETSAGSLLTTDVVADAGGVAQTTLQTTSEATVTASAGAVSTVSTVSPQPPVTFTTTTILVPPVVIIPPPTSSSSTTTQPTTTTSSVTTTSIPPMTSSVTTTTVAPMLTVALTCAPAAHGTSTPCNLTASYGSSALPSASIVLAAWDYGDGETEAFRTSPLASHVYRQTGTYVVVVVVTALTGDGLKTTTALRSNLIP